MSIIIAIVSGFASGVGLRSLFIFGWAPVVFVLLIAALVASAAFLNPRRVYVLGTLFFIFMTFGMVRAMIADTPAPDAFLRDVKHRVSYEGVVVSDPDVRDANQRFQIRVARGGSTATMLVVAPRNTTVAVGDNVNVSGTLEVPEPFADNGGRTFRYDKYLQRDGVRFILNYSYVRVNNSSVAFTPLEIRILAGLAQVKHLFVGGIQATLPEPYASLAGGVVIGGKSGLGSDLQNDFIRSGLIQIIVLSGYNVMVVAEWIMAGLTFIRVKKRWSAAAGAFALLVFVGIASFSATAIRAMIMALIALYARATARTYVAGRALLLVILLMLLWNPLYLVFDPGFGLSVVATAGLIWLAPIIEIFLRIKNAFWKNAIATTLSAQIAVLPLLLYDTGNLSIVAIPANLLTMPMVPLAMGLSFLAGFAGMLFSSLAPFLGIVLAFPAYLANAYLIWIAQTSAALPFSAFTLPLFPFWLVLASYAVLIYVVASKRFSMTDQFKFAKKASM